MTETEAVAFVETKRPARRYDATGPSLRVVLDICILKLATFLADNNASALIYELARAGLIEAWVSPAILEEYADVLGDHAEFVAKSSRASRCAIRSPSSVSFATNRTTGSWNARSQRVRNSSSP